jgi:hypothetical protein
VGGAGGGGQIPDALVGFWYSAVSVSTGLHWNFSNQGSYTYDDPFERHRGTFSVQAAADCSAGCTGVITIQPTQPPRAADTYTFSLGCSSPPTGGNHVLDLTWQGNTVRYYRQTSDSRGAQYCPG